MLLLITYTVVSLLQLKIEIPKYDSTDCPDMLKKFKAMFRVYQGAFTLYRAARNNLSKNVNITKWTMDRPQNPDDRATLTDALTTLELQEPVC